MDKEDWKRIEELVIRAGAAVASGQLTEGQNADAMSFHTLGLAIVDLNERLIAMHDRLARLEAPTHQSILLA